MGSPSHYQNVVSLAELASFRAMCALTR